MESGSNISSATAIDPHIEVHRQTEKHVLSQIPDVHDCTFHSGATASELAGLTPTFSGWTTDPGSVATIIKETGSRVLDVNGVGGAGANNIKWDLTTSLRRGIWLYDNNGFTPEIDISEDNVNWYAVIVIPAGGFSGCALEKFRYIKYEMAGIHTITQLRLLVYDIN